MRKNLSHLPQLLASATARTLESGTFRRRALGVAAASLLSFVCLTLTGCDEDHAERRGVGIYQLDRTAVAQQESPGKPAETTEALMAATDVQLDLRQDGTFKFAGNFLGKDRTATGSWVMDGNVLTLTLTERAGRQSPQPATIQGTYNDGVVRLTFEPGEPEMVFRRVEKTD